LFKNISVFLTAAILIFSLAFCGSVSPSGSGLKVVVTIFPIYDWVINIIGESNSGVDISLLLDSGVDPHSFQPSAEDIMKISICDLFIYVGGESDGWVNDALKEVSNKEMQVINLLEVLGDSAKEEEFIEGMQEHDHDHKHLDNNEEEHEHHGDDLLEYDEHVWLSLRNASVFVDSISLALENIDPDNAESYKINSESYKEKLISLDNDYLNIVSQSRTKTLLFGDRFPFIYLVDDYGLNYYAAFAGCSAETEATFETVIFLAEKVDELSLKAVMTIDGSDQKIAKTIIENTITKDQKILTLDSIQSTTIKDAENGATYLSIMQDNLEVLREALN